MLDVRNADNFQIQKTEFANGYLSQEYITTTKFITWGHFGAHLKHVEDLAWTSALELFERVWNTVGDMNMSEFGVKDPWIKDKDKYQRSKECLIAE